MKKYNKLVRDNIPTIIKKSGRRPKTRILDDKEYVEQLFEKLCEEIDEFDEDRNVEELADIIEVLMALARTLGISQEELKEVRSKKVAIRGAFKKRLFLERVEDD